MTTFIFLREFSLQVRYFLFNVNINYVKVCEPLHHFWFVSGLLTSLITRIFTIRLSTTDVNYGKNWDIEDKIQRFEYTRMWGNVSRTLTGKTRKDNKIKIYKIKQHQFKRMDVRPGFADVWERRRTVSKQMEWNFYEK